MTESVRIIFRRYVELGSVRLLKEELEARGIKSKSWTSASGHLTGGKPFSRGALYLMLQNRLYRGDIVHKGQPHPGEHTRSSISLCGMRSKPSSLPRPPSATPAHPLANRACSPPCCSTATAIG